MASLGFPAVQGTRYEAFKVFQKFTLMCATGKERSPISVERQKDVANGGISKAQLQAVTSTALHHPYFTDEEMGAQETFNDFPRTPALQLVTAEQILTPKPRPLAPAPAWALPPGHCLVAVGRIQMWDAGGVSRSMLSCCGLNYGAQGTGTLPHLFLPLELSSGLVRKSCLVGI